MTRPELAYTPTLRGLVADAGRALLRWIDGGNARPKVRR